MDRISAMLQAGFSQKEADDWATETRGKLGQAGFKDNEIDAFFTNGVEAPEKIPQPFEDRLEAGNQARKREGGLMQTIPQGISLLQSPEGRGKLWDAVKNYPSHFIEGLMEQVQVPGKVMKGEIDLSTQEGMDQAIGLGTLIGFGRLGKTTLTGKTSGMSIAMGETAARIERSPTGEIYNQPIGGLPTSEDFMNAGKVVSGGDAAKPVQEKLLNVYQDQGRLPAEVAHDAQADPIIAQRLLAKDPDVVPYGKEPPPPEPPRPTEAPPPEPPEPGSYEAAQQKILDKISVGEADVKRPMTFDRLYTETIDNLHPLKAVSEDAYELARLTRGQFGKAEYFLERGTFDFKTLADNGKPLKEVLAPVSKDLDGLRAYMTSKRALEIEASGRKSGVDLEAAQQIATEGTAKYGAVADQLVGYENRVLKYLKDSGVLSDEQERAMHEAGKAYVPFYRLIAGEARGPTTGKTLGPASPIKRLKGSEKEIIDPLESIIKNTYAYINVAERNAAGIKLIDALKEQGFEATKPRAQADAELANYLKEQGVNEPDKIVDFIKSAIPEEGDTLSAFRDGVKEQVKVNDPELVRAFRGIDQQSTGLITKILSVPAASLRTGAVLIPDFMARNLIRDFMTAFVNTKGIIFTPIDTLSGGASVALRNESYGNWIKAGGANSTMVALDRRYMQQSLAKLNGETGLMERSWNVIKFPVTGTMRGLRFVSESVENATRVAEFKKVLGTDVSKEAMQKAAFTAREVTLDFARMGAKMRAYNMITAFANAQIQGVDRIVRAFKDRPVNTSLKVAGGITLPSVLLWWSNKDDPRYQELPDWEKDLFWIIPTDHWVPISPLDATQKPEHLIRQKGENYEFNDGTIWRIPKPFELGVIFGSGPERALDYMYRGNKEAFDGFGKSVMQVLTPNYIPTAVQPMIEQFANRSSFTDRTLVPADVEKQLPEYQYTPYTMELSKKLGQVISSFPGMREAAVDQGATFGPAARALTTPILIENYVRSWSGGLGVYAMQAADASLRKAGVLPDPITPTPTLADIPFIKAFVVRYPSASTESIQHFYDDYTRNKRFFDTWMAKAQEGDTDAMARIQAAGGMPIFAQLDGIKETLSEHSKLIRDIYKNPDMPADEKRQLIDSLYYNMIQIGRGGRDMMKEIGKGLGEAVEEAPSAPAASSILYIPPGETHPGGPAPPAPEVPGVMTGPRA